MNNIYPHTRICRKCKNKKDISEFWKYKRHLTGVATICKKCQYQANKDSQLKNYGNLYVYSTEWRRRQTSQGNAKIIYSKKKHNAKTNGVLFNITIQEFEKIYCVDRKCYYCGISECDIKRNGNMMISSNKSKITIDRKDNNKGYTKDNVVLACPRCNFIKSNFFSEAEMLLIGEEYVKPKWN